MLERMGQRLTRFDGTKANYVEVTGCAIASAPLGGRAQLARDGEIVAAVEGEPEFAESGLATFSREEGAARALIQGYRDRGERIVESVKGGFSLVIVHVDEARALLAIDRIGGRFPLYYRTVDRGLVFGTTGDAIQEHPRGRSDLDPQAVFDYLYFHVVPAPRTARRGVSRLLPGTLLSFGNGHGSVKRYWTIEYTEDTSVPLSDREQEFRHLIRKGVRDAAGNAKTGCFLSGGTDSSTVAGTLSEELGAPVPTFSIGFDAKRYDEMKYARIATRHFGTEHHEYYLQPEDVVALIPRVAEIYSEPFGNESVVPAYHCARMARERGLDLLLGGDGGDELFAGNERYAKQTVFEFYAGVPAFLRRKVLEPILFHIPAGDSIWPVRKARSYVRQASVPMPNRTQAYAYLEQIGAENVVEPDLLREVDGTEPEQLLREAYGLARTTRMLNRFLAMDLRFTIADNDLPKVSRMCELAGIRVGFPLLSDDLVEFASRLPIHLKMKRLRLRWFFKHALRDFLPEVIIYKTKHGMGMPFGLWLRTHDPLQELVRDSLEGLKQRGIIQPAFIDRLTVMHQEQHAVYYGVFVWVLVQLEQWIRHHEDAAPSTAAS